MIGLRPLLRLEDKVAAEGRRLKDSGGPPMRGVAPLVLAVALLLHGAALLLPAVRTPPVLPAASPVPDLPLVWRPAAAPAPAPAEPAVPAAAEPAVPAADRPTPAIPPVRETVSKPEAVRRAPRSLSIEPVPEPAPELALLTISADVEAIIPNPESPPTSLELGPPSAGVPVAAPNLLERVSPVYPVAARSLRAEGRVTLRLAVLPDGTVGRATVEECSRAGLGFEAAALNAVKRWRYEPAPPETGPRKVVVTVHFQRQEGRP